MKILIVGEGQLAWDLMQTAPESVQVDLVGSNDLDITQGDACQQVIGKAAPQVVINAAAYTAVDKAETEREAAFAVNEQGVANLAVACKETGARLCHFSTDFVFEGDSNQPYLTSHKPNPLSVYGASKLAGEAVLSHRMPDALIIRTSWLYSVNGNNFVKTMLRLMAEKPELKVVDNQLGAPTSARGLAGLVWKGLQHQVPGGLYHWCDAGVASWYDFAIAIQDIGLELGLLSKAIPIHPIPASDYPRPAQRPAYNLMDTRSTQKVFGCQPEHWRRQLKQMLMELP